MKLRIAQLAPLWENVPPPLYGGTERVVYHLTEQLVQAGQDVTLFACGTSSTAAKLVSVYPRPLVRDHIPWSNMMYPLLNITEVFDRADEFDVIHVHLNTDQDYVTLPLSHHIAHKVVFTLHFPYPKPSGSEGRREVLQKYKDRNYISISNSQRQYGENVNWLTTVYNGINTDAYKFNANPKDYFIWVGKFNPDKGVYEAIQAAKQAGVKLILAGTIDKLHPRNYAYYKEKVEALIDGEQIKYVGEINDQQKSEYFGNAIALLNPIQWNEPFGLVMTECMATGTPVIAFRQGSAPELIKDGTTGYLVDNVSEMVEKMKTVHQLDRQICRDQVVVRFGASTMAKGYLAAYQKLVAKP